MDTAQPSQNKHGFWAKSRTFEILFLSGWLLPLSAAFLFLKESVAVTAVLDFAAFGVLAFWCALLNRQLTITAAATWAFFALTVSLYSSQIAGATGVRQLAQPAAVLGVCAAGIVLAQRSDRVPFHRLVGPVALGTALLLLALIVQKGLLGFLLVKSNYLIRDLFGIQPNYIGLICVLVVLCGLSLRFTVQGPLALFALLVSNMVQSRSALLTMIWCLGFYNLVHSVSRFWLVVSAAWFGMLCVALLTLAGVLDAGFFWSIVDEAFSVSDPYRGFGSGASGREEIWAAAIALWLDEPWLGVGYGRHQELMGMGVYAHNMVLVILAELGIVGLTVFTAISAGAAYRLFGERALSREAAALPLTVITSYWVYGIFEGRALNIGNAYSVLYLVTVFYVLNLTPVPAVWRGGARR